MAKGRRREKRKRKKRKKKVNGMAAHDINESCKGEGREKRGRYKVWVGGGGELGAEEDKWIRGR